MVIQRVLGTGSIRPGTPVKFFHPSCMGFVSIPIERSVAYAARIFSALNTPTNFDVIRASSVGSNHFMVISIPSGSARRALV